MQTLTPQQQLANRLYELLPHKKELEFGTTLQYKNDEPYILLNEIDDHNCLIYYTRNGNVEEMDNSNLEIIGQPLRLADLLLALDKRNISIDITSYGEIIDNKKNAMARMTGIEYNLQDDNILNQSNELCEFALGLLK